MTSQGKTSGSGPSDKASGMEPKPLYEETDARVWTDIFLEQMAKTPEMATDFGTMVGWFANAIMAGCDVTRWKFEKENAKLLREREEIIQQLATERDAFGKREIELMQKLNLVAEALNRGIERLKAVDQKHSGFTLKVMEEVITKLRLHEKIKPAKCSHKAEHKEVLGYVLCVCCSHCQKENSELIEGLKKIEKAGTSKWKDSHAVHLDFAAQIAKELLSKYGGK